jgi:hypothetical protein
MRIAVEEIFHEVADLSLEVRDQYFVAQHKIDTPPRGEVEALLAFDSVTNNSLQRDISDVARMGRRAALGTEGGNRWGETRRSKTKLAANSDRCRHSQPAEGTS